MKIDPEIISATSGRLDRKHGTQLGRVRVAISTKAVLPAERIARVSNYINVNRVADDTAALERAFGTNDPLSLYYFWAGLRVARAVGR